MAGNFPAQRAVIPASIAPALAGAGAANNAAGIMNRIFTMGAGKLNRAKVATGLPQAVLDARRKHDAIFAPSDNIQAFISMLEAASEHFQAASEAVLGPLGAHLSDQEMGVFNAKLINVNLEVYVEAASTAFPDAARMISVDAREPIANNNIGANATGGPLLTGHA